MSTINNLISVTKLETLMEKFGFRAGKVANVAAKVFLFLTLGLFVGLLIAAWSLSRGFRKGFSNKNNR